MRPCPGTMVVVTASSSIRISGANPVFQDSELILGLVAPVGTNFDRFQNLLERTLAKFNYKTNLVRLSKLTENFQVDVLPAQEPVRASEESLRLRRLMHAGNYLRFTSCKGEFLALAAAKAIRERRPPDGVMLKTAHVVRSLKHPDEVRALRRIYGSGFYLIGVTVDESQRRSYLLDEKGCSQEEVDDLLERDEHEEDAQYVNNGQNFGQRTRDTYHLADVFIPLDAEPQLERFLKLVFGCPFETPTPDEYAMFLAFAASLRSGDLSRQVGAVVVTEAGDLVAVGANDVPRANGGLYWPGDGDHRDHVLGVDSNENRRNAIVTDVLKRLRPPEVDETSWIENGKKLLDGSPLMDITEYGRAAHAEMEALLSCARSGVSTRGGTLFSTTFPCHNCAKHIIAAGIERVVYVEPYPKSQATKLFDDSIELGSGDSRPYGNVRQAKTTPQEKVRFEPFVGLGPRRYFDLFSIALSWGTRIKRKQGGVKVAWKEEKGLVRVPLLPNSYLEREQVAENELLLLTTKPEEVA